jgi:hypothetical protein
METETDYWLLDHGDTDGFHAMRDIYRSAIEPSEQKTELELQQMVGDTRYRILLARAGAAVIGFSVSFFPGGGRFWLLEYMAVARDARSKGRGASIFLASKRLAAENIGNAPCVLEVDQLLPHLGPDAQAGQRLRFYERLGCRRVLGLNYILPLDVAGRPPPMWLLIHGMEHRRTVPSTELAHWLTAIYTDVYGKRSDDPRLITMLSWVGNMNEHQLE